MHLRTAFWVSLTFWLNWTGPSHGLECLAYEELTVAADPELALLVTASERAVESQRAFGVEIEFYGDPLKVAQEFSKHYGGTIEPEVEQTIVIRNSEFGDVKIIIEEDGFCELVTDHRKYQPPEAFVGVLEGIYATGATGTQDIDGRSRPIGVHVSVASARKNLPKLIRTWKRFRAPVAKWAQTAEVRRGTNLEVPPEAFSLLNQSLSEADFLIQFLTIPNNSRNVEFNVYELARNSKEVVEVRLYNTETPSRLTESIRLSLGLAEWSN